VNLDHRAIIERHSLASPSDRFWGARTSFIPNLGFRTAISGYVCAESRNNHAKRSLGRR